MQLTTILTIAEVAYVIVLSGWILLEKRSPVATVAWILMLALLPLFGFAFFYFFGPRFLERKRERHKRARNAVRTRMQQGAAVVPDHLAATRQFVQLVYEAGGDPPSTAEQVTLLGTSVECYAAINDAIDAARDHVHVTFYICEPGEAGNVFMAKLVAAAARGVEVRLLMDAVGSSRATSKWLAPLKRAGGQVAFFNRVGFRRFRSPINFRNHRKIVVCDGLIGFTGGFNVCDDYVGAVRITGAVQKELQSDSKTNQRRPPWRDTHVMLRGNVVRWLQLSFFDDWLFTVGEAPEGVRYLPEQNELNNPLQELPAGTSLLQVVPGGPDQRKEPIRNVYFAAICRASSRVWITAAYFVPDEPTLTALKVASLRGVDVRVLVPRLGDSRVVSSATRSYYEELTECGVKLYEYLPTMHHAKTMIVDDDMAIVGSANFDARSFRLNFELMVVLYGPEHTAELARMYEVDLQDSERVTGREPKNLKPWERLLEATARALSPIL